MGGVIGLDVGGANTKAVWRNGDERRALSRPFEVWRDRDALAAVLREVVAGVAPEPVEAVALTTTAELSDAFRTKREGVAFVLDEAEAGLGEGAGLVLDAGGAVWEGPPLVVFTTAGELVSLDEARARAAEVAAANWMSSALAVAALYPDALMVDVGSTTADVVPIAAGRSGAPRPSSSRGSAWRDSCARTPSSWPRRKSTRSPGSCTGSRCARSRPRFGGEVRAGGGTRRGARP